MKMKRENFLEIKQNLNEQNRYRYIKVNRDPDWWEDGWDKYPTELAEETTEKLIKTKNILEKEFPIKFNEIENNKIFIKGKFTEKPYKNILIKFLNYNTHTSNSYFNVNINSKWEWEWELLHNIEDIVEYIKQEWKGYKRWKSGLFGGELSLAERKRRRNVLKEKGFNSASKQYKNKYIKKLKQVYKDDNLTDEQIEKRYNNIIYNVSKYLDKHKYIKDTYSDAVIFFLLNSTTDQTLIRSLNRRYINPKENIVDGVAEMLKIFDDLKKQNRTKGLDIFRTKSFEDFTKQIEAIQKSMSKSQRKKQGSQLL
jgi:hypothetical protein